jgi:hypothetical protein
MVDWDSKERGYPITGAELTRGCYLRCTACTHGVAWTWEEIWQRWPAGTYTRDIARALKCSQCGARKGALMAWAWTPEAASRRGG